MFEVSLFWSLSFVIGPKSLFEPGCDCLESVCVWLCLFGIALSCSCSTFLFSKNGVRIIIFLYYGGRRPFRAFFWCFFEPFQVPFRASPGACSSLAKRPDGGLRPVRACLGAFSSPFQVRFSSLTGRLFELGFACLESLCVGSLNRYRTKMLV